MRTNDHAIKQYGSAASAGAWALGGQATRTAWHNFPKLPQQVFCALGAAESMAVTSVQNAVSWSRGSASDYTMAAAWGCATSGGGGSGDSGGGRKLWQLSKDRTDRTVISDQFGRISRDKVTGLWWSRDTAGHGGSVWKVFREESGGLRHIEDADQYGDYIKGKHKGPVGEFIPWSRLRGVGG